jgi:hypothetical protein
MSWSGGSVSFSGGPNTYSVSYSAPTYTYPSGASSITSGSNSAPSSVSCGSSASKTYWTTYFWSAIGETVTSETTISGTAPSCPPPPSYPPSWSDNVLAGFQADVVYSDGVAATNMNYSGSYSVSSGSLPSGISLNTSSGAVTGTPTAAGQSYSFTVAASNSYGSVSQAFLGTVAASPTAGKLRVWTGTTWVVAPAKVWDGAGWVVGTVKVWNGTAWVTSV